MGRGGEGKGREGEGKGFAGPILLLISFVCYMRYHVVYFQCLCYLVLPLYIVGLCISFSFAFFKFCVFEAAVYANKDVYDVKLLRTRLYMALSCTRR